MMAGYRVLVAAVSCTFLCAAAAIKTASNDPSVKDTLRVILIEEQKIQGQGEFQAVDDSSLAETQSAIDTIKNALNGGIDRLKATIRTGFCNILGKKMARINRGHFHQQGNVLELRPRPGQYLYLTEIITIRRLNLRLQYVKFNCSSYALTIHTTFTEKQTIIPHFMSLSGLRLSLQVILSNPVNTLQINMNGIWQIGNLKIAVNLIYSRVSGNTRVTATPRRGTSVKGFVKSITSLSLPINPTINIAINFVGYINKNGFTTLALTSDRGQNKFYAIYQKQRKNTPSARAIAIDVKRLRLSTIIKKVINLDISRVPFFGTLSVKDLGLAYSTGTIINLNRNAFRSSPLLQRMNGRINKGLTAYITVSFHSDPIKITYQNRVLILTTPRKNLRLDRILNYLVSGGGRGKLSLPSQIRNIFRFNIEDITINKKTVKVNVAYPGRITFFKNILALSNVRVSITIANTKPKVSAIVSGIIHLADANFKTTLSKNQRGKYVLKAIGDKLSINELFRRLNAAILPKVISRFLSRIPFLNFKILKPRITYVFGARPLQFEIGGTPVVQGFRVTNVDMLIVKTSRGTKAILGFELGTFSFAEVLWKITRFNFGRFPILNQKVTSTIMISPISSQRLRFSSGKLASLTVTRGVSLIASMKFPTNCRGDKFCKFAGRLIGHTAVLSLKATISSATSFPISASINNLRLGRGILLGRAGIEIVGGALPQIGLVGEVHLRKPPLIFAARISVGTKGLSLELSVTNCWNRAFGAPWLAICNLLGSADFAPPTGITGLAFGGEIRLGYKSTGHQIKAKGYIGVSIIKPLENYYYVKFSRITMGSLLKAFKIRWRLPKPLAQSAFPNGYLNSFSLTGKELPQVHVTIPVGYRMKGTLTILGLQGYADITIGLPKGIDVKVGLPPIRIGRILAMYASPCDRRRGPYLRAKVQVLPRFIVHIEAAGYLQVLGISLETRLKITNTQYEFFIRGKILHLFQASLHITARYCNIRQASFRVRGEFKLDLFNGIKRIVSTLFRNIANGAKRALDLGHRVLQNVKRQLENARQVVSRTWNKLRRLKRKIFWVQVMKYYCADKACRKASIEGSGHAFRRGVRFISSAARRLDASAKTAYNRAKRNVTTIVNKVRKAGIYLNNIKRKFKAGLTVFNLISRRGLEGIINIRRLWFDVSLGSASLGKFSGGIDLQYLWQFNLKTRVSFDLRRIANLARSIFQKMFGHIKRIFG